MIFLSFLSFSLRINAEEFYLREQPEVALLHIAALLNAPEVIELLLELGADVNVQTSHGSTPLHFAAMKNAISAAKTLIQYFHFIFHSILFSFKRWNRKPLA